MMVSLVFAVAGTVAGTILVQHGILLYFNLLGLINGLHLISLGFGVGFLVYSILLRYVLEVLGGNWIYLTGARMQERRESDVFRWLETLFART
jgi:hypothetical protein